MSETEQAKEESVQPAIPNLVELLKGFENAPTATEIEKWKERYGEVFVSAFSETEVFVWRPLGRLEFYELQKKMRLAASKQAEEFTELHFEEAVVDTCILWSSALGNLKTKGGSYTTLSEQIMANSNFMDQSMAAVLVMKL